MDPGLDMNNLPGTAPCRCGHPFDRHYNGRGDCCEPCGCRRFVLGDQALRLAYLYFNARTAVIAAGFEADITWQQSVTLDATTGPMFVREAAWVILNSGMRASVVTQRWPAFRAAFADFMDLHVIATDEGPMRTAALAAFNYPKKVDAVIHIAGLVDIDGWDTVRSRIAAHGVDYLATLPFIGPVTKFHLAKNVGLPVAKPDRHLQRLADLAAVGDVQEFCSRVTEVTGVPVPVVDVVLWRWASISADYRDVTAAVLTGI